MKKFDFMEVWNKLQSEIKINFIFLKLNLDFFLNIYVCRSFHDKLNDHIPNINGDQMTETELKLSDHAPIIQVKFFYQVSLLSDVVQNHTWKNRISISRVSSRDIQVR